MAASPVTTVTNAVAGLDTDLLQIGAVGIGIGVSVLALKKGYRMVKSFF